MLKKDLINFLTDLVKEKVLTEQTAKQFLSLPLVEIPFTDSKLEDPWNVYNRNYPDRNWSLNSIEFVFLHAFYSLPDIGYFNIEVTDIDETECSYIAVIQFYPTMLTDITRVFFKAKVHKDNIVMADLKMWGKRGITFTEEEGIDIGKKVMVRILITLRIFADFQESLDLYPVVVQKEKPRLNKGNMNRVDKRLEAVHYRAPRLIYLNKLPNSKTDTISTPSGIKQRTHQRPGHWRTLKHEKYKNHDKYLIPKGLRIKPYWVGDRETVHEGNVYRLIMKEIIDETL